MVLTNHCTPLTKNHNNSIEDRCLWNGKLSKNTWSVEDVTTVTAVVAPDQLCSASCAPKQQDWAGFLPPVFFPLKDPLGLLGPLPPPLSDSSSLFLGPRVLTASFLLSVQQHIVVLLSLPSLLRIFQFCFVFLASHLFVLCIKWSKISVSVHCLEMHLYIHKRKCYRCPNKGKINVFIEGENHKQSEP